MNKAETFQWIHKRPWPQHRKLYAEALAEKGAGKDLLYFWYNCLNGNYARIFDSRHISRRALMYKTAYPAFEQLIDSWVAGVGTTEF